ncbi:MULTISPECIES: peptidoglycan-binding domain-containing protein [unclassified Streptomyces]|uniref:peptidoglycan-binding domain-containing protein n=1 Tax=unclassified Streptomyces TaxID=2593676 RepID=UPI00099DDDC1|nr:MULTISPECIES: peptidoglycan-binding domain-containing protein [unclassified Streptomyces]
MTHRPGEVPADICPVPALAGADPADVELVRPYLLSVAEPAADADQPADMTLLDGLGPLPAPAQPHDGHHHRPGRRKRRPRPGRFVGTAGVLLAAVLGGALYVLPVDEGTGPRHSEAGHEDPQAARLPGISVSVPASPLPAAGAVTPAVDRPAQTSTTAAAPSATRTFEGDTPTTGSPAEASPTLSGILAPHDGDAAEHSPAPSSAQETAEPGSPAEPRTLSTGDTGPNVTRLQQLLFGQGFTYVTVNGTYDEATRRGVTQLQKDRGLSGDPDGVYGPVSRASLDGT